MSVHVDCQRGCRRRSFRWTFSSPGSPLSSSSTNPSPHPTPSPYPKSPLSNPTTPTSSSPDLDKIKIEFLGLTCHTPLYSITTEPSKEWCWLYNERRRRGRWEGGDGVACSLLVIQMSSCTPPLRPDTAVNLAFVVVVCCFYCVELINFWTCACIDWLKVLLRFVFELCHPTVAMETVQDGHQTKNFESYWHRKYITYSRFVSRIFLRIMKEK